MSSHTDEMRYWQNFAMQQGHARLDPDRILNAIRDIYENEILHSNIHNDLHRPARPRSRSPHVSSSYPLPSPRPSPSHTRSNEGVRINSEPIILNYHMHPHHQHPSPFVDIDDTRPTSPPGHPSSRTPTTPDRYSFRFPTRPLVWTPDSHSPAPTIRSFGASASAASACTYTAACVIGTGTSTATAASRLVRRRHSSSSCPFIGWALAIRQDILSLDSVPHTRCG
ncbi:hypothetical protein EDD15DRAFT_391704 [Pisolithus albus]|nr:hypothetical protein EDD15DRAFT_391704 [Pisolithus albus]